MSTTSDSSPPPVMATTVDAEKAKGGIRDLESNRLSSVLPFFRSVFDQAGVTPAVLEWRYLGQGTRESPYVVEFPPGDADPNNPMKFSLFKRWAIAILQ